MRQALERRDIGAVFDLAHGEAGISFNKLAEATGIRAERVSQLAKGDGTVTSLPVLERIADGLRIPGTDLGLAGRPWEAPEPPVREEQHGDDPMKRRDVLRGALAAGLAGPGLAALTTTRHDIDTALAAGHGDVEFWESTAERYGYGYNGRPPAMVLTDIAEDFTELNTLLSQPQTVKGRSALCYVTGQMAGMAAIVLHDLGQHREAHRWFGTAARAAEQSGDALLHAWVLGREAMVPLNYGAPEAAAQLAERARHIAGDRPSAPAALATAVAARAHAVAGHRAKALDAVAAAETLAGRLGALQQADTWFGYPMQKHHVHMSQALTWLGETDRAYATQQQALRLTRTPSLMTRALIAIDTASCRARDGEHAEAARVALEAYSALPASYRTGLTRSRAEALCQSLPASVPGLDALSDALTQAA
ncbi:helix-turn-helix transcriptional regulator [Streptomyces sp. NPDC047968]|uniref:helix-turn-helix domain-containing protein n=1 Tax=unclassified Streptomyces TaxID=2593676 RepID=UPI00341678D2